MFKFFRNFFLLSIFTISSAYAIGDAFDQAVFDRLLKEGKPVLIAVHADWCATCRAQEIFLKELLKTPFRYCGSISTGRKRRCALSG